ncbi:helix-turn-helix domain-containing protein [Globicatella sanguinis]
MLNNFGYKLAQLRLSRNMTQKDMAKVLNVSQAYVGQWESGARVVPTEKVVAIAKYFDVSTDYLFGHISEKSASTDLKDMIRNQTLSYNGEALTEHDVAVIENFLDVVMNKEK